MTHFTESVPEEAVVEYFIHHGFSLRYGMEIAPGELSEYRQNYQQVILEGKLKEALIWINPLLPGEAIEDAFRKLVNLPLLHPGLVANNQAFHKYLADGMVGGQYFGTVSALISGLIFMPIGLLGVQIVGLGGGRRSSESKNDRPDRPIQNSLRSFLISWLIFTLVGVLSFGTIFGLIFGPAIGSIFATFGGLIFGLSSGLSFGGSFLIWHFIFRWQLYHANKIPFRLITFLDFAAERVFLHKVGDGYIFIHRMVMDHFAEMEKTG